MMAMSKCGIKFLFYVLLPPWLKKYFLLIVHNFAARTYYFLSYKNDIFTTVQDPASLNSVWSSSMDPLPLPTESTQTLILSNMILLQKELNWLGAVVNTTLQLKVSNGSTVDDYIYGIAADGYYGGVRSSSGIVWADCVHFTNRSM